MRDINNLTKEELEFLSKRKPSLAPMKVPSLSDAKLLVQPTLDQIIVQFLQQYEVYAEPRSVGAWNGWDTVSTVSSILSSERGSMSNIASTMFYANRSNQINSAAQDWGTWKRWVFDSKEKEFEQFKNELTKSINTFNKKMIEKNEEKIRKATLNNQKIFKELDEPYAQKKISELKELAKERKELAKESLGQKSIMRSIYGAILYLLMLFVSSFNDVPLNYVALIGLTAIGMNLSGIFCGIKFLSLKSRKKYLGIIGITLSATLLVIIFSFISSRS